MYCPRLDHFVRFNADGTIGKCGHMIDAPGFHDWTEMQSSAWLSSIRSTMQQDQWPKECYRCKTTEPAHSIRLDSIKKHQLLTRFPDYLILGGVLDNICNSACQSCNASHSTKIGSLGSKDYIRIDNSSLFDRLPMARVIEVDINGGEPTASPNYQRLLENPPSNVKIFRINTNGNRLLPNIERLLAKDIHVFVTLSLDGTGPVHDYVRWPTKWLQYQIVIGKYQELKKRHNNLTLQAWSTIHALNVCDFNNIKTWAKEQGLKHSWAYLETPKPLNVRFQNSMTRPYASLDPDNIAIDVDNQAELDKFINDQDHLRSIDIKDYL